MKYIFIVISKIPVLIVVMPTVFIFCLLHSLWEWDLKETRAFFKEDFSSEHKSVWEWLFSSKY